jgi:hypothetical protein
VAREPVADATAERYPCVQKRPDVGLCGAWYVFAEFADRERKIRFYGSDPVCEDKDDAAAWESLPETERERVRKAALAALEAAQLQNVRREVREMHFRAGMRFMTGSALRARRHHRGPVRTQNRRREPRRRSVSRGPRRARAPGKSGDPDLDPPPALAGPWQYLTLASSRMREHERRREARWRAAA